MPFMGWGNRAVSSDVLSMGYGLTGPWVVICHLWAGGNRAVSSDVPAMGYGLTGAWAVICHLWVTLVGLISLQRGGSVDQARQGLAGILIRWGMASIGAAVVERLWAMVKGVSRLWRGQ